MLSSARDQEGGVPNNIRAKAEKAQKLCVLHLYSWILSMQDAEKEWSTYTGG